METSNREGNREKSWGEDYRQTPVDRFGIWLSAVRIRRAVGRFGGKRIADVGCGFQAAFVRTVLLDVDSVSLVDLSISPELKKNPKVTAIEGILPEVLERLPDASFDAVICNSVLEHLWDPRTALRHIRRVLKDGGVAALNVPSWRGKLFLETAAFRLRVTSAPEIDDHKRYYSPHEFWTLLVESGFRPMEIRSCTTHKFGLNTFADCRVNRSGT